MLMGTLKRVLLHAKPRQTRWTGWLPDRNESDKLSAFAVRLGLQAEEVAVRCRARGYR